MPELNFRLAHDGKAESVIREQGLNRDGHTKQQLLSAIARSELVVNAGLKLTNLGLLDTRGISSKRKLHATFL